MDIGTFLLMQSPSAGASDEVYAHGFEQACWNMRVTLSLRNDYERVENGNAIPIPALV